MFVLSKDNPSPVLQLKKKFSYLNILNYFVIQDIYPMYGIEYGLWIIRVLRVFLKKINSKFIIQSYI